MNRKATRVEDTTFFEIAIYRSSFRGIYKVIHQTKNITVAFAKHTEFLKINEFSTYTLGE